MKFCIFAGCAVRWGGAIEIKIKIHIMTQDELFKILVAHCKEYGFIFPSSEIYDGLAAVYDYGQMGVELKNNIKR